MTVRCFGTCRYHHHHHHHHQEDNNNRRKPMQNQQQIIMLSRLILATVLLGFVGPLNLGQQQPVLCAPSGFDLNLGLELAQPQPLQQTSNTPAIEQILADNVAGEFALTEQVLDFMTKHLEAFALGQQLNQAGMMEGHEISRWLAGHGSTIAQNPLLAGQASELDFVFGTFWTPVVHQIQRIIKERPAQAGGLKDLAFRCEHRIQEIQQLSELGAKSSVYRILLDIFNTELYVHCLRRKMATLRLHHVEPPRVVQQLVDVYMELPMDVSRMGAANFRLTDRSRADYVNRMYAEHGQNFQLERAINRFGPVLQVGQLVLMNQMSFGPMDESHARVMAEQFRDECSRYTSQVLEHWANFDQVASILSSETNNLADFNNRFKYAQPQLIYASICNQLTSRLT